MSYLLPTVTKPVRRGHNKLTTEQKHTARGRSEEGRSNQKRDELKKSRQRYMDDYGGGRTLGNIMM